MISVLFASAGPLLACDLCAVYNASAARGESASGFHVALAEQFSHSGTLQFNSDKVSDPFDQFLNSSITSLIPGYNFTPRFGVSLNLPYIHREFRRVEDSVVERGNESGIGDMSLLGRFVAYVKPEHDYSLFVSLLAGLKFPTGDSDFLREEVNEVEDPFAPPSGVHGDDLTLGSGSFDPIVGISSNARWKQFLFALDLQYFIRTRGDFGFRFGNELAICGGPGYYLFFEESRTLALVANINYETKARDHVKGEKQDEGILTSWYAGPGLIFTFGEHFSATLNADIPIRIVNRDFQTVADYRVRGGVSWNF